MKRACVALAWMMGPGVTVIAHAGVLYLGNPTVEATQTTIPVLYRSDGQNVSAMNFRLHYDPAVFEPVETSAGDAATAAGKQVAANTPSPGEHIVVVMGLNQTAMDSGEVAKVVMRNVGTPESGTSNVDIAEPTLSTPQGTEAPVTASGQSIAFGGQTSAGESAATSPPAQQPRQTASSSPQGAVSSPAAPVASAPHTGATPPAVSTQPANASAAKTLSGVAARGSSGLVANEPGGQRGALAPVTSEKITEHRRAALAKLHTAAARDAKQHEVVAGLSGNETSSKANGAVGRIIAKPAERVKTAENIEAIRVAAATANSGAVESESKAARATAEAARMATSLHSSFSIGAIAAGLLIAILAATLWLVRRHLFKRA